MFKVSHEVPLQLLGESRSFNDYDYALVHLFEKYPDYFNFYKESLEKGRTVILDNSAYELGAPMKDDSYCSWIDALQPTEFVVPDYRDDYKKTIKAAFKWQHKYDHITKIGVVHGETYDDYCRCYLELLPLVNKIAFSYDSFFDKYQDKNMTKADTRNFILYKMIEDGILDVRRRHHLLGCLHPTEYARYRESPWVESVDTSNPIIYGMFEGRYPYKLDDYKKSSHKVADYMEMRLTNRSIEDIKYNVAMFKHMYNPSFEELVFPGDPLDVADAEFGEITASLLDLLKHKNRNYGNAAIDPIRVFTGKCNVGNRLDDKLSRVKASEELRKNDIVDLLGYLVLACRERGWKSFDEFKD